MGGFSAVAVVVPSVTDFWATRYEVCLERMLARCFLVPVHQLGLDLQGVFAAGRDWC